MNIFVTDIDPAKSAENLCDKHVVKMVCETAQLLSTAHHVLDNRDVCGLKATHVNHPCAKWVRMSTGNYMWLFQHFCTLLEQYTKRYGKIHAYDKHAVVLSRFPTNLPFAERTEFVYCGEEDSKHYIGHIIFNNGAIELPDKSEFVLDVIQSYRNYYVNHKLGFAKWNHGVDRPDWILETRRMK